MVQDTINGKRFLGMYRGIVRRHLFNGKCKVWVPGVYDNEYLNNLDKLPDAEQASPIFGGGYAGNGVFSYPNVGAHVWVFFQNGDQNLPVYWAVSNSGDSAGTHYMDIAQKLDPKTGKPESTVHKISVGRVTVLLHESGSMEIRADNSEASTRSKIFFKDDGTMEISSDKQITISAPDVKINGSSQLDMTSGSSSLTADRITVSAGKAMTLYASNFEKTVANSLGEIPGQ